jgi:hypothetical protein
MMMVKLGAPAAPEPFSHCNKLLGCPRTQERVTELHGTTHVIHCLSCGQQSSRELFQQRLASLNPAAAELAEQLARAAQGPPITPTGSEIKVPNSRLKLSSGDEVGHCRERVCIRV